MNQITPRAIAAMMTITTSAANNAAPALWWWALVSPPTAATIAPIASEMVQALEIPRWFSMAVGFPEIVELMHLAGFPDDS
jgi:hypothetical protein